MTTIVVVLMIISLVASALAVAHYGGRERPGRSSWEQLACYVELALLIAGTVYLATT